MPYPRPAILLAAAVLIAPAALALAPAIVHAEEQPEEQGGHEQLLAVIASDRIRDGLFEREMDLGFRAVFEQDEDIAAIEAECPGLLGALTDGLTETIRRTRNADYAVYRTRLLALLENGMSE